MPRPMPPEHSRFKKGQSGNPAGRARKIPALDAMLAEVLGEETQDKSAGYRILRALRTKALKGDVRAAEVLLNRAYGTPKQALDITSGGERITPPIAWLDVKGEGSK